MMLDYMELGFSKFPLPFALVLGGYALILLLDKVIADPTHHNHSNNEKSGQFEIVNKNPFESERNSLVHTTQTGVDQVGFSSNI